MAAAEANGNGDVEDPAVATVVKAFCDMGFEKGQVLEAMRATSNNPDRAIEYLCQGSPKPEAKPQVAAAMPQQPTAAGAAAPVAAAAAWAEAKLGSQLVTKNGLQPIGQALRGVDVVLLYFSAHWCPPCRQFTPMLASAASLSVPGLAIIFVSSDKDEQSFTEYYNQMPWLAIPFGAFQRQTLGSSFGVRGIPSLIALDAHTGTVLSSNGRDDVMQHSFNLAGCFQVWRAKAPAAAQQVGVGAAGSSSAQQAPPPAKKVGPAPLPIDEDLVAAALARTAEEEYEVQEVFFKTGLRVLDNTLQNPQEAKFRRLNQTNATLQTKFLGVAEAAGRDLLLAAGFEAVEGEMLALPGPPDGKCTAVRDRLQATATTAWEKNARAERDERIRQEKERDKQSGGSRYSGGGGDGGRMDLGRGRRGGGRGGGG